MEKLNHTGEAAQPLWTRDFTIITLGSVVSMFGNAMSGFAMSLLVLDYTGSSLFYAIYIAVFTLPQMIMPVFSGAVLDRFSRRRMIYTLDFISAVMYGLAALLLGSGWFSFPVLAMFCFMEGSINSIYTVAYESFYPLLITEGNYAKAYSISSVLETMTAVMIPVAAFAYNTIGIAPLMGINAVSFLFAALMEVQIHTSHETYIEKRRQDTPDDGRTSGRQLLGDIKEGFQYLQTERGLLAIAVYFAFTSLAGGASSVITLPYFKANFINGEYVYMLVWGMMVFGRMFGGVVHYRIRFPVGIKYAVALTVYILTSLGEGFYLYCPVSVMMGMCLLIGMLGVTSYTIRISATQNYVPDEKKGRFNGAFNMLNTVGSFSGELIAGGLTMVLPARTVLTAFMLVNAAAAVLVIGGNRSHVRKIYNTQQ